MAMLSLRDTAVSSRKYRLDGVALGGRSMKADGYPCFDGARAIVVTD